MVFACRYLLLEFSVLLRLIELFVGVGKESMRGGSIASIIILIALRILIVRELRVIKFVVSWIARWLS